MKVWNITEFLSAVHKNTLFIRIDNFLLKVDSGLFLLSSVLTNLSCIYKNAWFSNFCNEIFTGLFPKLIMCIFIWKCRFTYFKNVKKCALGDNIIHNGIRRFLFDIVWKETDWYWNTQWPQQKTFVCILKN